LSRHELRLHDNSSSSGGVSREYKSNKYEETSRSVYSDCEYNYGHGHDSSNSSSKNHNNHNKCQ
jgi:hypothetical protein